MAQKQFEKTMLSLGYVLEEQEGLKLTYKKERRFSILVLVIDLGLKYVNPILVPRSIILYQKEIENMTKDFQELRDDAVYISEKSQGILKVLN